MLRSILIGKLHGATVTGAELDYQGSISLDSVLMKAAGMIEHEKVLVANMETGSRFETYVIAAKAGSGIVCLNGATVHKGKIGDRVIVFNFGLMTAVEARRNKPRVVLVNRKNRPIKPR